MSEIKPSHYQSVQDYLKALGFAVNGDFFVRDEVRFPVIAICNHTPVTFEAKARREGWLTESALPLYSWADQFVLVLDFIVAGKV